MSKPALTVATYDATLFVSMRNGPLILTIGLAGTPTTICNTASPYALVSAAVPEESLAFTMRRYTPASLGLTGIGSETPEATSVGVLPITGFTSSQLQTAPGIGAPCASVALPSICPGVPGNR